MKVSMPVSQAGANLPPNPDPHVDPMKVPRFSAPMSFLKIRAFLAAVVLLSLAMPGNILTAAADCVCNYDPDFDYFPIKLNRDYATKYQLTYFKSYKKLEVTGRNGQSYVAYAYLCGTPRPAEATEQNSIQIPINSSAVVSTTFVPLIEYIGQRTSLHFVSADDSGMNPCILKMYEDDRLEDGFNILTEVAEINKSTTARSNGKLDVIFSDTYTWNGGGGKTFTTQVAEAFGKETRAVLFAQELETTPFGALEWLEVAAALYNREQLARYVVSSVESRYNCVKNLVLANPPLIRKKVLWGSGSLSNFDPAYDFWFIGSCPNFYCQLIQDAGGEILTGGSGPTGFANLAAQADVIIYTDGNWNTTTDYNIPFFEGARKTQYSNYTAVKNGQVFDILGRHINDWFENRLAEPDVLLMDLLQALHGTQYISNVRSKAFLRNVFTERSAPQGIRSSADCVNENAPLYTNWLSGPCFQSGGDTVDDALAPTLCGLKKSAGDFTTGISKLAVASVVGALALVVV